MIKVIVCGAAGKMGKTLIARIIEDKELELSGAVEFKESMAVGEAVNKICITDDFVDALKEADVAVDFTNPDAALYHLEVARKHRKPIVIGTTGIKDSAIEKIQSASKEIPIVFSPNMSVGVNVMFKLIGEVASALPNYDVEIIEVHHNQKKDAPSGTALKLADIISKAHGNLERVFGRHGNVGPRKKEIGIHSVRAGDIVGDHTVIFAANGERLELVHRMQSRDTLAAGAIKAAKWVYGKKPGLYTMKDILGL